MECSGVGAENLEKKLSDVKTLAVFGGGVLGSQIAFQAAFKGFIVKVWCRSEESITKVKGRIEKLIPLYQTNIDVMTTQEGKSPQKFCKGIYSDPKTYNTSIAGKLKQKINEINITYETDIQKAVEGSDIIIESIEEKVESKMDLYKKMDKFLKKNQIVCTNSSTLLPSILCKGFTKPENFLALHFANSIYLCNLGEIMGHANTDKAAIEKVNLFAQDLGMIPVVIHKEVPGYLLNSMLIPLLVSSLKLWANDVADPETIDKTWKISTGSLKGPMQICDTVGFNSIYNITGLLMKKDPNDKGIALVNKRIKEEIDKGKLGLENKKGFYTYE